MTWTLNQMRSWLKNVTIIRSRSTRLLGLLLFANGASNLVQVLVRIFIARLSGPEVFGIYSTIASLALTISLVIDAGILVTLIRLASDEKNKHNQKSLFQAVLLLELILTIISTSLILIFSKDLTSRLQIPGGDKTLIYLAIITAPIIVLFNYYRSFFQVRDEYSLLISLTLTYALLRLIAFGVFYYFLTSQIEIHNLFVAVYTLPLILTIFLFGNWIVPKLGLLNFELAQINQQFKLIFSYGRWVAINGLFYPLLPQIPVLLLSSYKNSKEVGIYSAAFTFSAFFSLLNMSIRQITLPTVSRFSDPEQISRYLKKIWSIIPIYILFTAIGLVFLNKLMMLFLGQDFNDSLPIFLVIGGGTSLTILIGQVNLLAHTLYLPKIGAYQVLFQGLALIAGGYVFIKWFSAGALVISIWYAIVLVVGEIGSLFIILKSIKSYLGKKS